MNFRCPHCQLEMSAEDEHAGQVVACPGCNGRFQIPALPEKAPAGTVGAAALRSGSSQRGGWQEEDHANVNFAVSLGIGVVATTLFLLALVPFKDKPFGAIFLSRGWVNYAEVFLFVWGMAILLMKWKKMKRQRQAMLLDVVPASLGAEINPATVGGFIDHIYKLPLRLRDSLMVNRVRKALELFEKRNNNGEISSFLNAQSDIDANRSSGSYTLLKVFLWAIPILGFIGTVQGLSVAVGSLSTGSGDPEELKNSINQLTGGLGVAFDTTLLGLVLSMIMSFPMAAMQKEEEEVLTLIDAFCNEKLMPKLNDSRSDASDSLLSQAENIPAFAASLARAHERFLEKLGEATALLSKAGDTLNQRLDAHQTKVEGDFSRAVDKLTSETRDALVAPAKQLNEYFASLSKGVASLDESLRKLGGQTVVVQKKGFFSK